MNKIKEILFSLVVFQTSYTIAQENNKFDFKRIEDNSFLIEEAYNQDSNVIQHISTFQYMKDKTWVYTYTQEWPVPNLKHLLSATIQLLEVANSGLGDALLNYRYQVIYTDRMAFSPRLSLLLPIGDYKKGLGSSELGYQINLPVSYICSRKLVTHFNLGATLTPNSKGIGEVITDNTIINYGVSTIILVSETFNLMFEISGARNIYQMENENQTISNSLFINPGFRYAINCKSGLEIIPGIAVPIGFSESKGEIGLFGYLSFEHPLWK